MTVDEYWNCDPVVYGAYRQAYKIKQHLDNYKAWLMGRYVYDAIGALSPVLRTNLSGQAIKAMPYLTEPYPITKEGVAERQSKIAQKNMEKMRARLLSFANQHNQKEGGTTDGNERPTD